MGILSFLFVLCISFLGEITFLKANRSHDSLVLQINLPGTFKDWLVLYCVT